MESVVSYLLFALDADILKHHIEFNQFNSEKRSPRTWYISTCMHPTPQNASSIDSGPLMQLPRTYELRHNPKKPDVRPLPVVVCAPPMRFVEIEIVLER